MPLAITEDHRALADVAKAMVAGRSGTAGARRILLEPKQQGRWWLDDGLWKEIVVHRMARPARRCGVRWRRATDCPS